MSLDFRLLAKSTALVGATLVAIILGAALVTAIVEPHSQTVAPPAAPSVQVADAPAAPPIPTVKYSGDGPANWHKTADAALQALLTSCPTLRGAATHVPTIELSWWEFAPSEYHQAYGWEHMVIVEMDLPDDVAETAPTFFRDPQWGNHLLIRLGAGRYTGAALDWPTDLWLCGMDDQLGAAFLAGKTRTWSQRSVLKPIPHLSSILG